VASSSDHPRYRRSPPSWRDRLVNVRGQLVGSQEGPKERLDAADSPRSVNIARDRSRSVEGASPRAFARAFAPRWRHNYARLCCDSLPADIARTITRILRRDADEARSAATPRDRGRNRPSIHPLGDTAITATLRDTWALVASHRSRYPRWSTSFSSAIERVHVASRRIRGRSRIWIACAQEKRERDWNL